MRRSSASPFDPLCLVILAVAGFLLFFRLDHRPFWQDEAETACLARNVLTYGVPRAFDGVNLISQEEGREFEADYIWRWSPWLQIYVTAAAFRLGGLTTTVGRLPFALAGWFCIWLAYRLVKRRFHDLPWAWWTAILLSASVPFLLFSRQCRYYSLGALLALTSVYAFRSNWQTRVAPAVLLGGSLGLLFYVNYMLFFSYTVAFMLVALLVYREELPFYRTLLLTLGVILSIIPGLILFRVQQRSGMLDLTILDRNLINFFANIAQFMVPLPVLLVLGWRWRRLLLGRRGLPQDPGEKFTLFLVLIILANTAFLLISPMCEHRYQLHLYPLAVMSLGWVVCQVWRYQKFSGVLLGLLLALTNWLHLGPVYRLIGVNRLASNDYTMLTYPNLPLKLYLGELISGYPDVNEGLIRFFLTHARPGETIFTTYGDLPLQFYTPFKVVGALQWRESPSGPPPPWAVKRAYTRGGRERTLNLSEEYALRRLRLSQDYQALVLPYADEMFGNRADPYYHRFVPLREPFTHLVIHRLKPEGERHAPSP